MSPVYLHGELVLFHSTSMEAGQMGQSSRDPHLCFLVFTSGSINLKEADEKKKNEKEEKQRKRCLMVMVNKVMNLKIEKNYNNRKNGGSDISNVHLFGCNHLNSS